MRAVFVAALCALGTCLIVYRGNTNAEDITLNASGVLLFVVAFVPTKPPSEPDREVRCSASNIPDSSELTAAIHNNVNTLFVVAALALVVAIALIARSKPSSRAPMRALLAFGAVLLVGVAVRSIWTAGFDKNAHTLAAIGAFLGILAVAVLNALDAGQAYGGGAAALRYRRIYIIVAVTMATSLAVLGLLKWTLDSWRHGVLAIEGVLLIEFMVFWVVQTVELWHRTTRDAPAVVPPT